MSARGLLPTGSILGAALAASLLAACTQQGPGGSGGGGADNTILPTRDMALRSVDWNPSKQPLGQVGAVVDSDQTTVVFGDKGAVIFNAGVVGSVDDAVTTVKAGAVIPAADHHGTWIAGADQKGQVWRLQGGDSFEDVSTLYGIEKDPVSGLAGVGAQGTAFALATGLAFSDGTTVTRFDTGPLTALVGGQSRAAGVSEKGAHVLDPTGKEVAYDLSGASAVAFDDKDRLLVLSPEAIYREDGSGDIVPIYKSAGGGLHSLASAPGRVWFTDGSKLGLIDTTGVALSPASAIPEKADLTGSDTGDVWILAGGALTRSALDIGNDDDRAAWEQKIQPIFHNNCTPCHLPGGTAGVVLATYDTWVEHRDVLKKRVIDEKTMPPQGFNLSDADRATIGAWLAGGTK
jgi:mono/diheme cytochrome c family protein